MILTLATLCLFAIPPDIGVCEDTVDAIELQHVYDDDGQPILSQFIFWTRGERRAFDVQAWRLAKGQTVSRDFARGGYAMYWYDGEVTRITRAKAYRETWGQRDTEMRERDFLPKDRRAELFKPRAEVSELLRGMASESDLQTEGESR